jgi:hypothetical protein
MSAKDGTNDWNGSDRHEFELPMSDVGVFWPQRRGVRHGVLPVHFDYPSGGCNSIARAMPEGSCEGDGQDPTND